MPLNKVQLLALLDDMSDSTEIVVPSIRNPASTVTQIARTDLGVGPEGKLMLILVPANILPFRPAIPQEASNESSNGQNPDPAA